MSERKKVLLASCLSARSPAGGGMVLCVSLCPAGGKDACHTDSQCSLEDCQMHSFILLCGQISFSRRDTLMYVLGPNLFGLVDVTNV